MQTVSIILLYYVLLLSFTINYYRTATTRLSLLSPHALAQGDLAPALNLHCTTPNPSLHSGLLFFFLHRPFGTHRPVRTRLLSGPAPNIPKPPFGEAWVGSDPSGLRQVEAGQELQVFTLHMITLRGQELLLG